MMRWLARLGGQSSGSSTESSATSSTTSSPRHEGGWSAAYASDPNEWERLFERCWQRTEQLLDVKFADPEHDVVYEEMTQVLAQLTQMCQLLMMEANAQPEPAIGPILDRFFTQQIMERVMDWAIQIPDFLKPTCQLALIRIYEGIVGESHTQNHCLLVHKPILHPLLRLFEWCKRQEGRRPNAKGQPTATDKHFVVLLNQICTKLAEDRTLLHFFFQCSGGMDQFVVFTLLIPFLYEQNDVGQLARDALLLILSVSADHDVIAKFVAYKSAFCPVVATGLSGCFSQLSRLLTSGDVLVSPHDPASEALINFHSSLVFCNAVVQAAHPSVVDQICKFFYSGFLISVVKPALLQEDSEMAAASTVYLQLCVDTVSETPLIRTLTRMILLEKDDLGKTLIQTIVERIRGPERLATMSLSLLDCLLHLGCEDIMLVLVLRHLLPVRHSSKAQLLLLKESKHTAAIAQSLLEALPNSMLRFHEVCSQDTLAKYLQEGAELVQRRAVASTVWKWKYDGINPSPLLFRGDSDDDTGHSSFSRLSSCRSSMSSAAVGLNRYFHSRSAHITAESIKGGAGQRLAALGQSPVHSIEDEEMGEVQEDSEFVLPSINTTSMMTQSMVDYFQLTCDDDLSSSDGMPSSPEGRMKTERHGSTGSGESSAGGRRAFDTDAEMARSFVLSGWAEVEDIDTFISLLDRRPVPRNVKTSTAEAMSFIDSKLQYMNELKQETEEPEMMVGEVVESETPIEMVRGQPIEEGADSSIFLEYLLGELEKMEDHSLEFNLQLANVLCSLAAYPQPILASYLFQSRDNERYPQMIKILVGQKSRLDTLMESVEGADVLVGRALRTLMGRSDTGSERHPDSSREDLPMSFLRGRSFGNSGRRLQGIRYHLHKVVETPQCVREECTQRQAVHATVVLASLCQFLAAIALQQSIVVVRTLPS